MTISRRFFLGASTAAAAVATALPAEATDVLNLPLELPPHMNPTPQQFMVGSSLCCVDWRWNDDGFWTMGSKESATWDDDGSLNEVGRQMLIEHFHLQALESQLPIEKLRRLSPSHLVAIRRHIERTCNEACISIAESDRPGGRIRPELCA